MTYGSTTTKAVTNRNSKQKKKWEKEQIRQKWKTDQKKMSLSLAKHPKIPQEFVELNV